MSPYVQNFTKFLCTSSRKLIKSRKLVSHGAWNKKNFPFGLEFPLWYLPETYLLQDVISKNPVRLWVIYTIHFKFDDCKANAAKSIWKAIIMGHIMSLLMPIILFIYVVIYIDTYKNQSLKSPSPNYWSLD